VNKQEEKCIEAVIRHLENKLGASRTNFAFPESLPTTSPDEKVDCSFTLADVVFCLEHTQIEPFEGYNGGGHAIARAEGWLRDDLKHTSYPGSFDVMVDVDWLVGTDKVKAQKKATKCLSSLIRDQHGVIQSLFSDEGDQSRRLGELNGQNVFVQRNFLEEVGHPAQPSLGRVVGNFDVRREDRFARAMQNKLPKLSRYAERWGAKQILVLENQDRSLSNWDTIANLAFKLIGGTKAIDYLFHIDTTTTTWRLFPLLEKGVDVHRRSNGLRNFVRFEESELTVETDAL
jgi:hypothetical protein